MRSANSFSSGDSCSIAAYAQAVDLAWQPSLFGDVPVRPDASFATLRRIPLDADYRQFFELVGAAQEYDLQRAQTPPPPVRARPPQADA